MAVLCWHPPHHIQHKKRRMLGNNDLKKFKIFDFFRNPPFKLFSHSSKTSNKQKIQQKIIMDTLNKPTWKDAHDVIMDWRIYHKEDDTIWSIISRTQRTDLSRQITNYSKKASVSLFSILSFHQRTITICSQNSTAVESRTPRSKFKPLVGQDRRSWPLKKNQELEAR